MQRNLLLLFILRKEVNSMSREQFFTRIRTDEAFRKSFFNEPNAVLNQFNLSLEEDSHIECIRHEKAELGCNASKRG